jgi:hypothetical protein
LPAPVLPEKTAEPFFLKIVTDKPRRVKLPDDNGLENT